MFHRRYTAAAIALLPLSAQATQPLVTDDTSTQGTGGKQIEAAYLHQSDCGNLSAGCTDSLPVTFTYGMTELLDLALSITPEHINPSTTGNTNGNGNTVLGAKYRFYEIEASEFSLALKPEIALPISSGAEAQGLGTGKTSGTLSLLGTKYLSWGSLFATLAANRSNYSDPGIAAATRCNQYLASVALLWVAGEKWQLGGEAGSYTQPDRTLPANSRFAQLAAIWSPDDDTDFAFGIRHDYHLGDANLLTGTIGITYRFK